MLPPFALRAALPWCLLWLSGLGSGAQDQVINVTECWKRTMCDECGFGVDSPAKSTAGEASEWLPGTPHPRLWNSSIHGQLYLGESLGPSEESGIHTDQLWEAF